MAGTSTPAIPHCRDLTPLGERLASTLYTAHHDRLGQRVTVTVYPAPADDADHARFADVAATAARLAAHPNVLAVHDWGRSGDGRPWVVTDPQPAETVDTVLRREGPLPVDRALHIGVLVAGALETAHRAGVVHGDLTPARLVFGPQGEPLVADVGLAQFSAFPGFGALHNPIRYFAPPEVLERTGVTPASDVYSLATTVYALLAGRAPHEKPADITDSNASLLLRILQMEIPPIVRPDLPAGLEAVLHVALDHAPEKRPPRAVDLAWSLQDVQRRGGLEVTEPIVLEVGGAAHPGPAAGPTLGAAPERDRAAGTAPAPGAPAPGATPAAGPVPDDHLTYLFSQSPPDRSRFCDPGARGPALLGATNGADPGTNGHGPRPGPELDGPGRNGHHPPPPPAADVPNARAAPDPPPRRAWAGEAERSTRPGPDGTRPVVPTEQRRTTPSWHPGPEASPGGVPTRPGSVLDRARQARNRSSLVSRPAGERSPGAEPATRRRRSPVEAAATTAEGPPALPVIVLIVLVVLLTIAVAYMIVTDVGSDADEPGAAPPARVSLDSLHQA